VAARQIGNPQFTYITFHFLFLTLISHVLSPLNRVGPMTAASTLLCESWLLPPPQLCSSLLPRCRSPRLLPRGASPCSLRRMGGGGAPSREDLPCARAVAHGYAVAAALPHTSAPPLRCDGNASPRPAPPSLLSDAVAVLSGMEMRASGWPGLLERPCLSGPPGSKIGSRGRAPRPMARHETRPRHGPAAAAGPCRAGPLDIYISRFVFITFLAFSMVSK
jgi:hypothetical protein